MQNGHYITRSLKYTRWDFNNLRPQCFVCNMRNQGMSHVFRAKLVQELGEDVIRAMEERSALKFSEPDSWIQEVIQRLSTGEHNPAD